MSKPKYIAYKTSQYGWGKDDAKKHWKKLLRQLPTETHLRKGGENRVYVDSDSESFSEHAKQNIDETVKNNPTNIHGKSNKHHREHQQN